MTPAVRNVILTPPFNPYRLPGLEGAWSARNAAYVTASAANAVSQLTDLSGKGRHLVQGTGAAQPNWLFHYGINYGYLPGVSGNYFSTPSAAANRFAGDRECVWVGYLDSLTPAANAGLVSKYTSGGNQKSFIFYLSTAGALRYNYSANGSGETDIASTVTIGSVGLAVNTVVGLRATQDVDDGSGNNVIKFYYSTDAGATWTQLGATVTTAGTTALFDSTADLLVGAWNAGAAGFASNKCVYATLTNGLGGTEVARFDARQAANNASSFVSSTGETWTINKTGAKPAHIVASGRLLFDGSNWFQKAAAFTLNQPTTVYLFAHPITYTSGRYLCDGNANDSMVIEQSGVSPAIDMYAGSVGPASSQATLAAWHMISGVFNGASSRLQVDNNAASTGDVGAGNAGGFTLMAAADGTLKANFLVSDVLVYSGAHDAATRARVYQYFKRTVNLNLP